MTLNDADFINLGIFKLNLDLYVEIKDTKFIYYYLTKKWYMKELRYIPVEFDEVLDNISAEQQTVILFNLDMFK